MIKDYEYYLAEFLSYGMTFSDADELAIKRAKKDKIRRDFERAWRILNGRLYRKGLLK